MTYGKHEGLTSGILALLGIWAGHNNYIVQRTGPDGVVKVPIPDSVYQERARARQQVLEQIQDPQLKDNQTFTKFAYDTLYNLRSSGQFVGDINNMRFLRRRYGNNYRGNQRFRNRIRGNTRAGWSNTITKRIKRNPKKVIRGCVKNIGYARRLLRRFRFRRSKRVYRRLHNQRINTTHYAQGKYLFNKPQMNYDRISLSITRKKEDKRFYVFGLKQFGCYNVMNFLDPYAIIKIQQYRMLKLNYINMKLYANFLWSRYRANEDIQGMANTVATPATSHLQASMIPQFPKVYIYWQRGPGLEAQTFDNILNNRASDTQIIQFLEEGRGIIPLNPTKRYANLNYRPPNDARRYITNPFQQSGQTVIKESMTDFYNHWGELTTHNDDFKPQQPIIIIDTKYWKDDIADIVIDIQIKNTVSLTSQGQYSKYINNEQPAPMAIELNGGSIKVEHQKIKRGQTTISFDMIRDLLKKEPSEDEKNII